MKKLKKPPLRRQWFFCPYCGTKIAVYDNTSVSVGVYVKCKTCKREVEVRI